MPKIKTALKRTRELFRPDIDSSSDSDDSVRSEEYSHVPIKDLSIPITSLNMTEQNALEAMARQMQAMMEAINSLTAKQMQYDTQMQNDASSHTGGSRDNGNTRTVMGDPFRIPDPLKILPTFNGNKKQLYWWLDTAEKTLKNFEPLVSPEIYQIYLTAVSNKIEGYAKDVLCTNGNPNTFEEIKEILIAALGDKQDLSTYNCQLWHNKMDGSVSKHYQKTKQLVHSIKALAKQNPKYNDHWEAVNDFIDEYSLAAYVSGLQKPYFGYVQAAKPNNIENAYAFICKFTSNETNREMTLHHPTRKDINVPKPNEQKQGFKKPIDTQNKTRYDKNNVKSEPMEVGSTRSRLTLNNQETHSDGEEDETEIQDTNFCVLDESDSDT